MTKNLIAWLKNSDVIKTKFRVIDIDPVFNKVFHDFDNFYHEISCGFYEEKESGKRIAKYDRYRDLKRNGYLAFSNKDKNDEFVVTYEKEPGDQVKKIIDFFKKAGVIISEVKEG